MKLWRTCATYHVVIASEERPTADALRLAAAEDASEHGECAVSKPVEVRSLDDLPSGWHGICIPWGEDSADQTISDILASHP